MLLQGRTFLLYLIAILLIFLVFGWSTHSSTWRSETLSNLKDTYLGGSRPSHEESTAAPPFDTNNDLSDVTPPPPDHDATSNAPPPPPSQEQGTGGYGTPPEGYGTALDPTRGHWNASAYIEVSSSKLSADKKWFKIIFGEQGSYNPNIIPHPWKENTWYMIAQGAQWPGDTKAALYNKENICEATFKDGHMQCIRPQTSLPIASTISSHCQGREGLNKMIGPSDARVFNGPDAPYIIYGSASSYTCYGLYIHDLRRLATWDTFVEPEERFFWPTEVTRPPPTGPIEKNWFAFWSDEGEMYLHHDIEPRVFSKLSKDGKSVSPNLASAKDETCIQRYKPVLADEHESIHQATNSLAVTMCKRSDPACVKTNHNTFVFTIFHHKQYHGHNLYEPYVMMFNQTAPFEMFGISPKPIWINGRGKAGDGNPNRPEDQSEMMYITSMSWKEQNMTYHGYLDDDIFINFGIDDEIAGTIDVLAADLLREISPCD